MEKQMLLEREGCTRERAAAERERRRCSELGARAEGLEAARAALEAEVVALRTKVDALWAQDGERLSRSGEHGGNGAQEEDSLDEVGRASEKLTNHFWAQLGDEGEEQGEEGGTAPGPARSRSAPDSAPDSAPAAGGGDSPALQRKLWALEGRSARLREQLGARLDREGELRGEVERLRAEKRALAAECARLSEAAGAASAVEGALRETAEGLRREVARGEAREVALRGALEDERARAPAGEAAAESGGLAAAQLPPPARRGAAEVGAAGATGSPGLDAAREELLAALAIAESGRGVLQRVLATARAGGGDDVTARRAEALEWECETMENRAKVRCEERPLRRGGGMSGAARARRG